MKRVRYEVAVTVGVAQRAAFIKVEADCPSAARRKAMAKFRLEGAKWHDPYPVDHEMVEAYARPIG